ncbi:MAG: succinylglutamate desuccinylase/aspartoacylase family protein, partial [Anaerolineae bacterium]|nr:succinylglutamate desuccinylase/aspartoacylase family protein [Anaerolineae bacterium]
LRGTIIAVYALNPAGLQGRTRQPYYLEGDPNRVFPDPAPQPLIPAISPEMTSDLEAAYRSLYALISATHPACLLDLHNATIGSIPFAFRDPVLYSRRGKGRSRPQALDLQTRVSGLFDALGLTVVNEYPADSYIRRGLHRSVSGAVLNGLSIPSATLELGSWMHVDPGVVAAGLTVIYNALRWAGMLPGPIQPVEGVPVLRPGYAVRRHAYPVMPAAGIAEPLLRPGELIAPGQVLAQVRDIFGKPLGRNNGLLSADFEGFVLGWRHGVVRYKGETIMTLGIRDDSEAIIAYPE